MDKLLLTFVVIGLLGCSTEKTECPKDLTPKTIMAVPMGNNGQVTYDHYVIVEKLELKCLDSLTLMRLIDSYIARLDSLKPVAILSVFNKIEDFDSGENLSQPSGFWNNQILEVKLDTVTGRPLRFRKYGGTRTIIQEGSAWQ